MPITSVNTTRIRFIACPPIRRLIFLFMPGLPVPNKKASADQMKLSGQRMFSSLCALEKPRQKLTIEILFPGARASRPRSRQGDDNSCACDEAISTLSWLNDAGILPPLFSYAYVIRLRRTMSRLAQAFDSLLSLYISRDRGFLSHRVKKFFYEAGCLTSGEMARRFQPFHSTCSHKGERHV